MDQSKTKTKVAAAMQFKFEPSQQGASSTDRPGDAEKTTGGRDSPVAVNLPNGPIKVISQGVGSSDTPPQGASSSIKPMEGGDLQVASKVGRLHLAKTRLSGSARRKVKKARERQSGTVGLQQPGHLSSPKSGGSSTKVSKRPRSECSTPTEQVNPPKRPRDLTEPENYGDALTNIRVAIKENYPEDKLSEEEQDLILDRIAGAFRTTPEGNLPRLRSYRLEGGALMRICADHQSRQWLKNAMHGHKLREGTTLTVIDAKDLPKPVKMALRTGDKQSKDIKELLQWIGDLNPRLSTEH
jgi:hypothetical protein